MLKVSKCIDSYDESEWERRGEREDGFAFEWECVHHWIFGLSNLYGDSFGYKCQGDYLRITSSSNRTIVTFMVSF